MKTLSGPSVWKKTTTPSRRPVSSDATVTTVVMPMTIPSTVRSERNLWLQTACTAICMFSVGLIFMSVGPERYYGVQFRGARRGIPSRNDADYARYGNGEDHVRRSDPHRDIKNAAQQDGD